MDSCTGATTTLQPAFSAQGQTQPFRPPSSHRVYQTLQPAFPAQGQLQPFTPPSPHRGNHNPSTRLLRTGATRTRMLQAPFLPQGPPPRSSLQHPTLPQGPAQCFSPVLPQGSAQCFIPPHLTGSPQICRLKLPQIRKFFIFLLTNLYLIQYVLIRICIK
jgi:hypothetical protein